MAQPYHKLPANFFNDDLPTAELQRNPNATEKTHLLVPNDSAGDGAVVVKAPHGGAKRSRIESAAREEELKFKIRKDKTKKKTTSVGGILYRLGHASAWCCLHIRYAIFIDAGILLKPKNSKNKKNIFRVRQFSLKTTSKFYFSRQN